MIAGSDAWTLVHLVIVVGLLLMFLGLAGIAVATDVPGDAAWLVPLAVVAAVIGTVFGLATLVLDGVAAKELADAWAADPGEVTLASVTANETVNFALAGLFNLTFAGVPYLLLGSAFTRSRNRPHWLGWIAVAFGGFSVAAGVFQLVTGHPTTASLALTITGPTMITLWTLGVGLLLLRDRSPVAGTT